MIANTGSLAGYCRARVAAGLAVAALAAAGCGGNTAANVGTDSGEAVTCEPSGDVRLGIATGPTAGVFFSLGTAFAGILGDATGDRVRAIAAETGGSIQNIEQLVDGKYQLALAFANNAADAVEGKDVFTQPQPVQALARLYDGYTHLIARKDAKIDSVTDLEGKRVSTGPPKSGTEFIAERILSTAGLDPDADIKAQRLDLTKTVDGMKSGTIDAMFYVAGLPTPGITDLVTTARDEVSLIDLSAAVPKMQELSPAYDAGTIPADVYGLPATPTVTIPNLLLAREDLDANVACAVTKVLVDKLGPLGEINAAARDIDPATLRDTDPVELHRGAVAALDAAGLP